MTLEIEYLDEILELKDLQNDIIEANHSYDTINRYIEVGQISSKDHKKLNTLIRSLPRLSVPITVYRHSGYIDYQTLVEGQIYINNRNISASYDPIMATDYFLDEIEDETFCCRLILHLPAGFPLYIANQPENEEHEVIIPPDIVFKVNKINFADEFYQYLDDNTPIKMGMKTKEIYMTAIDGK